MNIQTSESPFYTRQPPRNFQELMSGEQHMEREGSPNFTDLRKLAQIAQAHNRESGSMLIERKWQGYDGYTPKINRAYHTLHYPGEENSVNVIPRIPDRFMYESPRALAMHSHNYQVENNKQGYSFQNFPSLNDLDLPESETRLNEGGAINLYNTEGMTFCLGRVPVEAETIKKKKLRFLKRVVHEEIIDPYWEVVTGVHAGLRSDNFYTQVQSNIRFPESILIASYTYPLKRNKKYFAFISWDHIFEAEKAGITFQDIAFGNGLHKLVDSLGLNYPHQSNLRQALTTPIEYQKSTIS